MIYTLYISRFGKTFEKASYDGKRFPSWESEVLAYRYRDTWVRNHPNSIYFLAVVPTLVGGPMALSWYDVLDSVGRQRIRRVSNGKIVD